MGNQRKISLSLYVNESKIVGLHLGLIKASDVTTLAVNIDKSGALGIV